MILTNIMYLSMLYLHSVHHIIYYLRFYNSSVLENWLKLKFLTYVSGISKQENLKALETESFLKINSLI